MVALSPLIEAPVSQVTKTFSLSEVLISCKPPGNNTTAASHMVQAWNRKKKEGNLRPVGKGRTLTYLLGEESCEDSNWNPTGCCLVCASKWYRQNFLVTNYKFGLPRAPVDIHTCTYTRRTSIPIHSLC